MSALDESARPLNDEARLEFGNVQPDSRDDPETSTVIVASYNIRYAVGRFLISSGILRKAFLAMASDKDYQADAEKVSVHKSVVRLSGCRINEP